MVCKEARLIRLPVCIDSVQVVNKIFIVVLWPISQGCEKGIVTGNVILSYWIDGLIVQVMVYLLAQILNQLVPVAFDDCFTKVRHYAHKDVLITQRLALEKLQHKVDELARSSCRTHCANLFHAQPFDSGIAQSWKMTLAEYPWWDRQKWVKPRF